MKIPTRTELANRLENVVKTVSRLIPSNNERAATIVPATARQLKKSDAGFDLLPSAFVGICERKYSEFVLYWFRLQMNVKGFIRDSRNERASSFLVEKCQKFASDGSEI